jgi:hypothetical protein
MTTPDVEHRPTSSTRPCPGCGRTKHAKAVWCADCGWRSADDDPPRPLDSPGWVTNVSERTGLPGWMILAVGLIVAVLAVPPAWDRLRWYIGAGPTLSASSVEEAIESGYADRGFTVDATCPAGEPMKPGTTFDCDITGLDVPAAGMSFHHVLVRVTDNAGHLSYQAY